MLLAFTFTGMGDGYIVTKLLVSEVYRLLLLNVDLRCRMSIG